jgi:hypothetical protein
VREALLPADHTDSASVSAVASLPPRSHPLHILALLWRGWHVWAKAMVYYVSWLLGLGGIPTESQLAKFISLRSAVEVKFNENDPEHQVTSP